LPLALQISSLVERAMKATSNVHLAALDGPHGPPCERRMAGVLSLPVDTASPIFPGCRSSAAL
jgi:hypothetical protein